jgi:hypothetical protein
MRCLIGLKHEKAGHLDRLSPLAAPIVNFHDTDVNPEADKRDPLPGSDQLHRLLEQGQ